MTSITVAIPCYNEATFIDQTLRSINHQSLRPSEIIVVDDGSSDTSRTIVKRHTNVRLISHKKNLGIASARNTAWKNASGEIIVFIDADAPADYRLVKSLIGCYENGNVAGVGGQAVEVNQSSLYDRWRREILFQSWGNKTLPCAKFLFGLCSSYRTRIPAELGGFDRRFQTSGEDVDFSYRVRKAGYKLVYNPKAIVYHQRTDNLLSLKKMVYRHSYWAFVAQRKNGCYEQKVSLSRSAVKFLSQIFIKGLMKRDPSFAWLTIILHGLIIKAWHDSKKMDIWHDARDVAARYDEEKQLILKEYHRINEVPSKKD